MTQTPPEPEPCYWPVDEGCLGDQWETYSAEVQNRAIALATATLERLTAYRVTNCPVTVDVNQRGDCCFVPFIGSHHGPFTPGMNIAGKWVNNCGCSRSYAGGIHLPPPVGRLDAVSIDGLPVALGSLRLVNGHIVARVDGEPLEWTRATVTYLNGYPPDQNARYAAGILANEYAKACTGGKCKLPPGVTSVVRQGITMEIASGSFPGGNTGLREVDAFIALWNPRNAVQPSRVWSPDLGH